MVISFLQIWKIEGGGGGGGFLSEILSVVGYRYFLEPHILRLKNKAKRTKPCVACGRIKAGGTCCTLCVDAAHPCIGQIADC